MRCLEVSSTTSAGAIENPEDATVSTFLAAEQTTSPAAMCSQNAKRKSTTTAVVAMSVSDAVAGCCGASGTSTSGRTSGSCRFVGDLLDFAIRLRRRWLVSLMGSELRSRGWMAVLSDGHAASGCGAAGHRQAAQRDDGESDSSVDHLSGPSGMMLGQVRSERFIGGELTNIQHFTPVRLFITLALEDAKTRLALTPLSWPQPLKCHTARSFEVGSKQFFQPTALQLSPDL